ncbi:MAG: Peptidyl-prolyl cis-trans isomerase B [Chlamydiae bacterium]|nr:Peptidyl-prolyl cis-trans isomerase B [Chlamydiota bacterium]
MSKNPSVQIRTNKGEIEVELFADKAPDTVKNFLQYVDEKHYNNTIFHRVIDGFMIQGGGFTPQMRQKPTHDPIRNEGDNGEKNMRGTIAMARISDPHSATAQFFINVSDNDFLNYRNQTPGGFGYCVFGKVTKGMEVVDKIKSTPTTTKASMQDVPVETIEILSITKTRS